MSSKMSSQDEAQRRMEAKFDQIAKNHLSSIHNLEVQIGQLVNAVSARNQGNLPSNTETNPREQLKEISLRSGKVLEPKQDVQSKRTGTDVEGPLSTNAKIYDEGTNDESEENQGDKENHSNAQPSSYVTRIPFPQRLKKQQTEQQFSKFLDIFKKLQINIPFAEALAQMPQYAKFLKEIITNRRRWEDDQTVSLTEKCSSIITSKMPTKLKDPRSFTIPCVVGSIEFPKCLCDLGSSINLMPLSIFRKLGIGEVKPTLMTLQLVDHSIKKPHGVVEDVLVKVDKFIFLLDFVVLDFEEDHDCTLILGRPFLNTGKALVDVYEGKLTLQIGDDKVEFNMSKAMKHPMEEELCMRIDVIDSCVKEVCQVSEVEQDFEDDAVDGNACDTEPFAK
ncbi:PREDICTED: uncharacterized protein LOC104608313 [Nelumbo nucifera]|uniref:Uncharacterized protein LOC104608313 n=1 Tax=Nelumbo nucifera TaxID=4432 RepID=A0A1U8B0I5_NELNU|nr:PREDICTED: uncharacterized protein LOC104608313 [Nelumbo nucifera]